MFALCIENDPARLQALTRAVEQCPDIRGTAGFTEAGEALLWAETHAPDVVFLAAEPPGMETAARLRQNAPLLPVIFCADSGDYALEALQMHANGYLLRPAQAPAIQAELEQVKLEGKAGRRLLTVRCYGSFTVLDRMGRAVTFKRRRTAELLALLFHYKGTPLSANEICHLLWNDNRVMLTNNRNYLRQLLVDLRAALNRAGAEQVIRLGTDGYYADMALVRLEAPDASGEPYLPGYAWAKDAP